MIMERREKIWRESLSEFDISPESNVSLFLRNNERAILDEKDPFSSGGFGGNKNDIFLMQADVLNGYVEIAKDGSLSGKALKGLKEKSKYPLMGRTGINQLYENFSFHLDETGKPIYERYI